MFINKYFLLFSNFLRGKKKYYYYYYYYYKKKFIIKRK